MGLGGTAANISNWQAACKSEVRMAAIAGAVPPAGPVPEHLPKQQVKHNSLLR